MRAEEIFDPASVEKIIVATSSFAVRYNGNTTVEDTMDAQYSIPYCVAVALTGDPMDPNEYAPDRLRDPQRRTTANKVDLRVDPLADSVYPKQFACTVTLHFVDGRTIEAHTRDAHGTPADSCTPQELIQKFSRLAELSAFGMDASAVISCVNGLASGVSARELATSLRPRA
jgi:2-methylcitrate dehydratase PrpD